MARHYSKGADRGGFNYIEPYGFKSLRGMVESRRPPMLFKVIGPLPEKVQIKKVLRSARGKKYLPLPNEIEGEDK
jgi:hypothetical protein